MSRHKEGEGTKNVEKEEKQRPGVKASVKACVEKVGKRRGGSW